MRANIWRAREALWAKAVATFGLVVSCPRLVSAGQWATVATLCICTVQKSEQNNSYLPKHTLINEAVLMPKSTRSSGNHYVQQSKCEQRPAPRTEQHGQHHTEVSESPVRQHTHDASTLTIHVVRYHAEYVVSRTQHRMPACLMTSENKSANKIFCICRSRVFNIMCYTTLSKRISGGLVHCRPGWTKIRRLSFRFETTCN